MSYRARSAASRSASAVEPSRGYRAAPILTVIGGFSLLTASPWKQAACLGRLTGVYTVWAVYSYLIGRHRRDLLARWPDARPEILPAILERLEKVERQNRALQRGPS